MKKLIAIGILIMLTWDLVLNSHKSHYLSQLVVGYLAFTFIILF